MTRASNRGAALLEAVILLCLTSSAFLFTLPTRASARILANEVRAVERLQWIARAENLATSSGQHSQSLAGILSIADSARPQAPLADFEFSGSVMVEDGYCFIVWLCDAGGAGVSERLASDTHASFWLAFAWPRAFGASGRRLFVVGSDTVLMSWENELGKYDGPDKRPKASLVLPSPSPTWPLAEGPLGWEKSIRWRTL